MMKVLIVEDDRALGLFLQKGLKLEGHEVRWVEDGEAALEQLNLDKPDLMVLDLSLPRRDGIEVLEELQTLSIQTSTLVLTGRNNLEERIRCLNLGADDCLLKPFSFHELAARCRAILRRQNASSQSMLSFAGVEMDLVKRKVLRHGEVVELTTKEFALLECLVRKQGTCCSRGELLREVWHTSAAHATNVVDVYINYLRKKLATLNPATFGQPSQIETVRGSGYRLVAERRKVLGEHENLSPSLLALGA